MNKFVCLNNSLCVGFVTNQWPKTINTKFPIFMQIYEQKKMSFLTFQRNQDHMNIMN